MSGLQQQKNLSIVIDADVSEKWAVGDFQRGSFVATAVTTGDINFDVSNDGTNWDTIALASGVAHANITAPAANKPRALPVALFAYKYARFKASAVQATADAAITVSMFGN